MVLEALTFDSATSLTSAANCLEFCSNTLAVFTPVFDICLETSFACCSNGFHASRVEKITLFESLMADRAPLNQYKKGRCRGSRRCQAWEQF